MIPEYREVVVQNMTAKRKLFNDEIAWQETNRVFSCLILKATIGMAAFS